jgi:hypothetical protein
MISDNDVFPLSGLSGISSLGEVEYMSVEFLCVKLERVQTMMTLSVTARVNHVLYMYLMFGLHPWAMANHKH